MDNTIDFAIIRLGYGNRHLDESFYENVNGAIAAGLQIGVYYYSYALDTYAAEIEANFLVDTLLDCGLTADRLPMGVWFDQEDADGYKARNGVTDGETLTEMCAAFVNVCRTRGFKCGVYVRKPRLAGEPPRYVRFPRRADLVRPVVVALRLAGDGNLAEHRRTGNWRAIL